MIHEEKSQIDKNHLKFLKEHKESVDIDIFDCEKRLPLKKRKISLLLGIEAKLQVQKNFEENIPSYPAKRMISIADLAQDLQANNKKLFKTPAEKKEMPLPVAVCIPFVQLTRLPQELVNPTTSSTSVT